MKTFAPWIKGISIALLLGICVWAFPFHQLHSELEDESLRAQNDVHFVFEKLALRLEEKYSSYSDIANYFSLDLSVQKVSANTASPQTLIALYEKSTRIMDIRKEILQFTVLDLNGKELYRVNRLTDDYEQVSYSNLQNKGDTPQFQQLKNVSGNQIYASPFALNKERGKLSNPPAPVTYVAKGVTEDDSPFGYVLLTIDSSLFLEDFASKTSEFQKYGSPHLITKDAGWISGHKDFDWAYLFEETRGENFAKYFPRTFAEFANTKNGPVESPEGHFLVRPFSLGHLELYFVFQEDSLWKQEALRAGLEKIWPFALAIFVFSTLFFGVFFKQRQKSKIKEASAKESQTLSENTEKSIHAGFWSYHLVNNESKTSHQVQEICDLKDGENLDPSKITDFFQDESRESIHKAFQNLIDHMQPFDIEAKFRSPKLGKIWVRISGQVQEVRDGKLVACNGILQDINDLKEHEEKLKASHREAFEAQKFQDLREMAGAVAHEINSPLNFILKKSLSGLEDLNAADNEVEKTKENFNSIHRTAKRIAIIVSALRKLSKKTDENDYRNENLYFLAEEAIKICQAKLDENHVRIENTFDSDCEVLCSGTQITQVFINLINNAIDATKGSTQRWIKLESKESLDTWEFFVKDSGTGIPTNIQEKIFESFFTTKAPGEGTGYGLHLSREIADQHGGTLSLDTSTETTNFVLSLPKTPHSVQALAA